MTFYSTENTSYDNSWFSEAASSLQDQLEARRLEQQEKYHARKSSDDPVQSPVRKKFESDEELARRLAVEESDFETAKSLQREEDDKMSEVLIIGTKRRKLFSDHFHQAEVIAFHHTFLDQLDEIQEINATDVEASLNGIARETSPLPVSIPDKVIDESIVRNLPPYNLANENIRRRIFTNPDADPGVSCTFDVLKTIRTNVRLDRRVQDVYFCADCAHFASDTEDTGFSCGYRNAQVLISCMYNFPVLRNQLVRKLGDMYVPSIEKMQRLIEKGWREGWDPQGAKEHNFRLV